MRRFHLPAPLLAASAGAAGLVLSILTWLAFGPAPGIALLLTAFSGSSAAAFAAGRRRDRPPTSLGATPGSRDERYRELSEVAPVMLWTTNAIGMPTFVSQEWLRFVGREREDVLGDAVEELRGVVHPEDFPAAVASYRAALDAARPFAIEYRLRRHDGVYRWVHDSGQPRLTADGTPDGFVGIVIDVDDRRRDEVAQRTSEQRLRMLVENVPLVQYIMDTEGHFLLMEGRSLASIDADAEEFANATAFDVYRDNEEILGNLRRALAGESVTGVVQFMDLWWEVFYTPIFDGEGQVTGVTVVGLDVSEREHAKAALELSEMRYRLIANATIDAIWDWDLVTGEMWRSESFSTIFGYGRDMLTQPETWWRERVHPDDLAGVLQRRTEFLAGSETSCTLEYRNRRADAKYVQVVTRMHVVRDADGTPLRIVGSVTDVTEQRELERQFLHAQKLETVGRLAGGIAHDFSNLMTAIMVTAELDLLSPPSSEALREDLEEIKATAERAANLSRQLLSYSRRQIVEPQVLAVNDLLASTQRMIERLIGDDVTFRIECSDESTCVRIDPGQLEQVLVNMAVNARDAMPNGGELTMRTRRMTFREAFACREGTIAPGEYVMLQIDDTGAGMSDDVQRQVFEPFFTTKGLGAGTGLGLPTSYGIVKQAGGEIVIESVVGRGSTFKVFLPLAAEPADMNFLALPTPDVAGGNETVLLVEDAAPVRRSASRVLRALGYTVIEAGDGREGLAAARANMESIDLIITDIVMPLMSGKELAEALLAVHPEARFLFLSGYTDDPSVREGIRERTIDFIQKPFTPSTLAEKVRQILDREPAAAAATLAR